MTQNARRSCLAALTIAALTALAVGLSQSIYQTRTGSDESSARPLGQPSTLPDASTGSVRMEAEPDDWFRPKPLPRLGPGLVIDESAPHGFSHLLLVAQPRLGVGDLEAVSPQAKRVAELFFMALAADVAGAGESGNASARSAQLQRVAVGLGVDIQAAPTIISTETHQLLGADLDWLAGMTLKVSERILDEYLVRARTSSLLVFDAPAPVRRGQAHHRMVIRYAVVLTPGDKTPRTFLWLLRLSADGSLTLADDYIQLLLPGFREDRVLAVMASKIHGGVPEAEAFAVVQIPSQESFPLPRRMRTLAAAPRFNRQMALRLQHELQQLGDGTNLGSEGRQLQSGPR